MSFITGGTISCLSRLTSELSVGGKTYYGHENDRTDNTES